MTQQTFQFPFHTHLFLYHSPMYFDQSLFSFPSVSHRISSWKITIALIWNSKCISRREKKSSLHVSLRSNNIYIYIFVFYCCVSLHIYWVEKQGKKKVIDNDLLCAFVLTIRNNYNTRRAYLHTCQVFCFSPHLSLPHPFTCKISPIFANI